MTASIWHPSRLLPHLRLPVLLYAPGWNGRRTDNAALAARLAASGYVVAAFDDLARLLPNSDPRAGPMDFSSDEASRRTESVAAEKARLAASLASALLDRLTVLGAPGSGGNLSGLLDMRRAGIFGFSFGGAVAAQAAWQDKRLRAVLNMDGWLFANAASEGVGVPYFSMSDGEALPGAGDLHSADPARRNQARLTLEDAQRQHAILARSGGYELSLADTIHADFIDQGWRAWALDGFGRGHAAVARVVAAYTQAFFDQVLKGQASSWLRADTPRPATQHFVVWTAPSPSARPDTRWR